MMMMVRAKGSMSVFGPRAREFFELQRSTACRRLPFKFRRNVFIFALHVCRR